MATPKQIEANRKNALNSTGPRTPEGKAAVRLNSLVHGLRSQEVVLTGEDKQAFDDVRQAFLDKYRPEGPDELYCLEKMLACYWRSRRLPVIEAGLFNNNAGAVSITFTQDPAAWDGFSRLTRYETSLDRAFYRALAELKKLQAGRPAEPVTPPDSAAAAAPPRPDPGNTPKIGFARQNSTEPKAPPEPPKPSKRYQLFPDGKWRELPPVDPAAVPPDRA